VIFKKEMNLLLLLLLLLLLNVNLCRKKI